MALSGKSLSPLKLPGWRRRINTTTGGNGDFVDSPESYSWQGKPLSSSRRGELPVLWHLGAVATSWGFTDTASFKASTRYTGHRGATVWNPLPGVLADPSPGWGDPGTLLKPPRAMLFLGGFSSLFDNTAGWNSFKALALARNVLVAKVPRMSTAVTALSDDQDGNIDFLGWGWPRTGSVRNGEVAAGYQPIEPLFDLYTVDLDRYVGGEILFVSMETGGFSPLNQDQVANPGFTDWASYITIQNSQPDATFPEAFGTLVNRSLKLANDIALCQGIAARCKRAAWRLILSESTIVFGNGADGNTNLPFSPFARAAAAAAVAAGVDAAVLPVVSPSSNTTQWWSRLSDALTGFFS